MGLPAHWEVADDLRGVLLLGASRGFAPFAQPTQRPNSMASYFGHCRIVPSSGDLYNLDMSKQQSVVGTIFYILTSSGGGGVQFLIVTSVVTGGKPVLGCFLWPSWSL